MIREKAATQAIVVGKRSRVTLPNGLVQQLGLQAGDLLLMVPQDNGAVLVRRIDGKALIDWLQAFDVQVSIPADEMLTQLRRLGFGAALVDGRVSYEGGLLDVWTNTTPAVRDGEVVIETTNGLYNAADVLDFVLETVLGKPPPTIYSGAGSRYRGWVDDLAKRLGIAE